MNKLSRKFIAGISAILLITMAISLYINSSLIQRYYLYEKKIDLDAICDRIEGAALGGAEVSEMIAALENEEEVTIVGLKNDSVLNRLNEELREALRDKGIGFQKFWLWEEDYQTLMQDGRIISKYNQGKLNYSLLVEYMELGEDVYAVAMIIPYLFDAIAIINTVTAFVMISALLVAIALTAVLVKRITKPLDRMKQLAGDIAARNFHSIEVNTRDELETVAVSMNQMCAEIETYQNELLDKNWQMSEFLDNVAHDLKTPIALTKAYAGGIKDGMDDGTFLDTIIRQNDRMSELVENLLLLSRIEKREIVFNEVSLDGELEQLLEEQSIFAAKEHLFFQTSIVPKALIQSSAEQVNLIFSNMLSNALKYSSGKLIEVSLEMAETGYLFEITNDTDAAIDTTRLWEPFYVGEASRNKDLSGTGIGLALVKVSAEKIGASVSCRLENGKITFQVLFECIMK